MHITMPIYAFLFSFICVSRLFGVLAKVGTGRIPPTWLMANGPSVHITAIEVSDGAIWKGFVSFHGTLRQHLAMVLDMIL